MFKSEVLHRREHLAERNLCCKSYLPVEVQAAGVYGKGGNLCFPMGISFHIDYHVRELEFNTVEPEVLCCVHKLLETRNGNRELFEEEPDLEVLEARGDNMMDNCFQVSAEIPVKTGAEQIRPILTSSETS